MEYRVGGNIEFLKRLLAANYPVIVESVTSLDPNDALGPNDDLWAAHYLLLTGYDDGTQTFTIQDSYHGADLTISYSQLEEEWKPFNNLYIVIYFPQFEEEMKSLLGSDWDPNLNRQKPWIAAQADTGTNPLTPLPGSTLAVTLSTLIDMKKPPSHMTRRVRLACPCGCSATSLAHSLHTSIPTAMMTCSC